MVYAKLDWFSVVLYNKSVRYILKKLKIDADLYEEMLLSGYERSQGFSSVFVLSTHGISIELKYDDYLTTEQESLFDVPFSKIRLDISGTGLDYLRSIMQIDVCLTDKTFWGDPEDYNVTRSDFAFDFVNFKGEFVDMLLNWIKSKEMSGCYQNTGRLSIGRKSGVMYSYRCGDQKTIYLGSPRGDKLVRIYDKKMQYTKNGVNVQPYPEAFKDEGAINSWFRIEFQTRRKCADSFLYCENNDLKNVLRVIFDDYLIRDDDGKPLDFMVDLYKWEELPPIIQNQKYAIPKAVLQSSYDYVMGQAFKSVFILLLRYGADGFIKMLNDHLTDIYLGTSTRSIMGNIALRNKLAQLLSEECIELTNLPGLDTYENNYYIKRVQTSHKK